MAFSAMRASESFSTRFPLKLWRLLNTCNSGAISWGEHGRSIKIYRRRFEKEYLMTAGSTFKTSNFSSFVRQLNLYGFRKIINVNTFRFSGAEGYTTTEVDIQEYHHPFFRLGHPDLLNRVQRRMKGKKIGLHDAENNGCSLFSKNPTPVQLISGREPLSTIELNNPVSGNPAFQLEQTPFTWSSFSDIKPVSAPFISTIPLPPGSIRAIRKRPWTGTNSHLSPGHLPPTPTRIPYSVKAVPAPYITFTPIVPRPPSTTNAGPQPLIVDKRMPEMMGSTAMVSGASQYPEAAPLLLNASSSSSSQYCGSASMLLNALCTRSQTTGQPVSTLLNALCSPSQMTGQPVSSTHGRNDHTAITMTLPTQSLMRDDILHRPAHDDTSILTTRPLSSASHTIPFPMLSSLPITETTTSTMHLEFDNSHMPSSSVRSHPPTVAAQNADNVASETDRDINRHGIGIDLHATSSFSGDAVSSAPDQPPVHSATSSPQLSSADSAYRESVHFPAHAQLVKATPTANILPRALPSSTLGQSTMSMKGDINGAVPKYVVSIGDVKVEIADMAASCSPLVSPAYTPVAQ